MAVVPIDALAARRKPWRLMTPHVYIEDLQRHEGREVELKGWLYAKRSSGKLVFLEVRDGSGIAQCVVFNTLFPYTTL